MQRRLTALGFDVGGDESGHYGAGTTAAVRRFQDRRGLPADGRCDDDTWAALVEAGYRLGDRSLYRTRPMLRGDDVAELQRRLNALGFDAGRVDGIFGPRSEQALVDFQRNAGLVTDSICGPATIAELQRISHLCDGPASFATLREREQLRRGPRSLVGRVVVIGDPGGAGALASAVVRAIGAAGGRGLVVQHPEASEQALQANTADADVYLGLSLSVGPVSTIAYYRSPGGWESAGGRRLADLLAERLAPMLGATPEVRGMGVPALRETRMPAVLAELSPPATVVERSGAIAIAVAAVLDAWVTAVIDG